MITDFDGRAQGGLEHDVSRRRQRRIGSVNQAERLTRDSWRVLPLSSTSGELGQLALKLKVSGKPQTVATVMREAECG